MKEAENYYDITDKYIHNELSQIETANFKNELEHNPVLYHQYQSQKENIKHIKEYKFNSLKQRLNNIDISYVQPSIFEATSTKVFGIMGGVFIIAVSTYFGFIKESDSHKDKQTVVSEEITTNTKSSISSIEKIAENNDENIDKTIDNSNVNISKKKKSVINSENQKTTKSKINNVILKDSLGQDIVINNDKVSPPNNFDNMTHPSNIQDNFEGESIAKKESDDNTSTNYDIIDSVTFNKDSKYSFHYQFVEGKLIIHGNFEHLYKIFDIRFSEKKREFYLRYNHNYYHLDMKVKEPKLLKKVSKDTLNIIKTQLGK